MRPLTAGTTLLLALACGGAPVLPTPDGFPANVHGVCEKYQACECNVAGTVDACIEEFGEAADTFPTEVWACMLARDCEAVCEYSAGTCMLLYAEQVRTGTLPDPDTTCPDGQQPLPHFDLTGTPTGTLCQ